MSLDAATIAARITVLGADKAAADIARFSHEVDKAGDKVKASGKQTSGAFEGVTGSVNTLNQGLGFLGLSVGAGTLVTLGKDAIGAANSLEQTEAVIASVSGSTGQYNSVLSLAHDQQEIFGGSLNKNLLALKALIPLSNNAGVSLKDLNFAAQQLAASDPAQGFEGAAFAIREFLSSADSTALRSLAERFELPKSELQAIKEAGGSASEQIAALTELMNRQGYTAQTVAAQAETTAHTYTELGSAFHNVQDAIGGLLAHGFEPLALGTTGLLNLFGDTRKGMEQLAGAVAAAGGYSKEEAEARKQQILAGLDWLGILPEITASTEDMATATDAAAAAAGYYASRLTDAATAATKGFSIELSDSAVAARDNERAIDALTDKVGTYEQAVSNAQAAVNRQSLEIQVAERSLRDEQAAVESANDAVAAQERVVRDAEASLAPYQDAIDNASAAVADQERAVRAAESALGPFQDAVDAASAAVTTQERAIHNAEAALGPYRDAVEAAQDAVKDQQRAIQDAERGLRPYQDAVKAAAGAVEDQQDRIKDAEKAYGRYEDAIDRAKKRQDRATESVTEAKAAFDDLKDSIQASEREIDRLKGTPLMGTKALQDQMNAIQDQITAKELELVNAQLGGASEETIKGIREEIDKLQLSADKLKLEDAVANDATRRKIDEFGESVKEMSGDQILAALQKQQQQVDSLTKQLWPVDQAWQSAVASQDSARRSVERAERAYGRYKDSLEPLRDELGRLQDAQKAAADALDHQQEAIEPLKEELGRLKERLDDANDALDAEDAKINPLRESLVGLKGDVEDARDAYDQANGKIDAQRDLLEKLKDRQEKARDAFSDANGKIDTQRDLLEKLKLKQDAANLALDAAEKLLKPLYEKQQTLNDKLVNANLALATANELYGPQITHLEKWEPAAAAAAKAASALATAMDAAASAQLHYNDAVNNAPPYINVPGFAPGRGVPDYINGTAPYQPGGRTGASGGVIYNGIESDDPRPSQAGINAVVQGGTLGSTFDADRGALGVHAGLDLRVADGSPVHAPLDLFDIATGSYSDDQRAGLFVQGTDRKGRRWYFGHLGSVAVKDGDFAPKGAVLGYVAAGMGHTHVQLQRIPAPAGTELIDPSAALEESALGANAVAGSFHSLATDGATAADMQDGARAVDDAAAVIEVAVDALRTAAGYKSSDSLSAAMQDLKEDLTLALQTLMDVAKAFDKDGVEAGAIFAGSTEDMLSLIVPAIQSMKALQKYEGIAPNLLDWFGADLRLVVDKLLDVAHYYQTDGVIAAAELYDALGPVLGVIDSVVQKVAYFQDYQGLMPNLLDWFGSDARLIVDKMLDIAQYYNTDGANAAADTLEGLDRTLEPISALAGIADMIRNYKGFPTTNLNWIGGDMRAVVDKVIDVDRYIAGGEDAANRVTQTLTAVSQAMATGISMADAVAGYDGGGQATAVFGDITDFVDSVTEYWHEIRRDGVRPALLVLESQMALGGQAAISALLNALTADLSGFSAAGSAAGSAYAAAFNAAMGGISATSLRGGGGGFFNLGDEMHNRGILG